VEGDSDMSNQGKFRAIPARYVISVFEIKSRFNSSNIIATKLKLSELLNIKDQLDDKFSSGVIFAELKEIDNNDKNALHKLSELTSVPGFIGGIILRYEKDSHITGLVSRIKREDDKNNGNTDSKRVTPLARPLSDIELYKNEDGNITLAGGIKGAGTKIMIIGENTWAMGKQYFVDIESGDKSINIAWSKSGFADFSHRLLNALEGMPIMSENYPLFGQIFDNVNFRPAPLQPPTAIEGKPFIDVELEDINGEKKEIFSKEKKSGIKYILKLNNISKHDVTFIKEEFYDTLEVKGGRSDNREYNIIMKEKKSIEDIIEILKKSPVEIKHRLVYKDIEGSYFAVECLIKIGDKIDLKILNEEDLANFHKKNT